MGNKMTINAKELFDKLPPEQQDRIQQRTKELIEEEYLRQQLMKRMPPREKIQEIIDRRDKTKPDPWLNDIYDGDCDELTS